MHPPSPFCLGRLREWGGGGGVEPPNKFLKRRCLTGSQFLEGIAGKQGGNLIQGGGSFYIKNKLNSEKCKDKKSITRKYRSSLQK